MITVEVRTPVDLERLVVDRRRLLLYPQTRIRARPGEMVLLDVRVGERRIVIWARAHFTVPEGRGPLFACATADRGVLYTLMSRGFFPGARLRPRFPLRPRVRVRCPGGAWFNGRLLDLSAVSARIELPERFAYGAPMKVEIVERLLPDFPRMMDARILGSRADGIVVHFSDADAPAWRQLRAAVRRIEQSGSVSIAGRPSAFFAR